MTFFDREGRRTRLWLKDEVTVGDKQAFMDMLVARTLAILNEEPIDIYVNPTFLPEVIAAEYDQLWTPARMQPVIAAAVQHGVAIEINARYRIPSLVFLKLAKKAGAKFSFGTNNTGADVGRVDYCFEAAKALGLRADDMFMPKPAGRKPIQLRN
jgi:histidinol phosphatase-like PHP family hydrolase